VKFLGFVFPETLRLFFIHCFFSSAKPWFVAPPVGPRVVLPLPHFLAYVLFELGRAREEGERIRNAKWLHQLFHALLTVDSALSSPL
jgi:hypothetical protein